MRHEGHEVLPEDKHIEVIIFDLGNTLIRFDHNISAKKLANLFHLESEKVRSLFFDSAITRDFEKGLISPREFHVRMTSHLGISLPFKDFVDIWNDIFWEDKESCDLARRLKAGYKLFLLSNVNRMHYEFLEKKFDILKIFDEIILSYDVGAMKPELKIFDDAIRKAGGDKKAVVYIDDREDLISEARAIGIDSIRYEGAAKLKEELLARGVHF